MKIKLYILASVVFAVLCGCSTSSIVENYVRNDAIKEKFAKFQRKSLVKTKLPNALILEYYRGLEYQKYTYWPNVFRQKDLDYLTTQIKNDKELLDWTKEDAEKMGLELAPDYTIKDYAQKELFYTVSKPFFLRSKDTVLFAAISSRGQYVPVDMYLVMMARQGGKWKVIGKYVSDALN